MQINAKKYYLTKKYYLICLLLCFLFLTSYLSVLHTNDITITGVNIFNIFSVNGGNEHSMDGSTKAGNDDFMAVLSWAFSGFLTQQSQWLGPNIKTGLSIFAVVAAVQAACLIYYSTLSDKICTQFNSIMITIFLHKKDGMK